MTKFMKIPLKKFILILFIMFSLVFRSGFAMDNPSAKVKSLGGAGVALKNNPISINPASIVYAPYGRLSIFYENPLFNVHYGYMEFIYPFGHSLSAGGAVELSLEDNSFNHFKSYHLSLSGRIFRWFSMGISGRAIMITVDDLYGETIAANAGIHMSPFKWLDIGLSGQNLNRPEIKFGESNVRVFERRLRTGLSIFYNEYFNITADVYVENFDENFNEANFKDSYGMEIRPVPPVALRGGIKGDSWRLGAGIISKNINFDYGYISEDINNRHFFQWTYKFGVSPSRKEMELKNKELEIKKDGLYLDAVRYFNKGDMSAAKEKIELYINDYGLDDRMSALKSDIDDWLNRMRKEKFGRAEELKKEILRDYYQGKIKEAVVKLENAKLLAPNYVDLKYLEHLLNARILLEEGKFQQAEEELIQALKINPDSKEVINLHGRIRKVIKLSE